MKRSIKSREKISCHLKRSHHDREERSRFLAAKGDVIDLVTRSVTGVTELGLDLVANTAAVSNDEKMGDERSELKKGEKRGHYGGVSAADWGYATALSAVKQPLVASRSA